MSSRVIADYYLSNGCKAMQWLSKAVVEVKIGIHYSSISRIYQSYYPLCEDKKISKLVILYNSTDYNDNIEKYLETLNPKFITIVDFNKLSPKYVSIRWNTYSLLERNTHNEKQGCTQIT